MLRTDGESKQLQAVQRRKARERERGTGFTSTEFEELCKQYDGRCLCCGGKLDLVADHVVPLFKGGGNSIDNIQPLCRVCNSQKHTLTVDFREEVNRFRFFVSKSGNTRHIVDNREERTLCGLQADTVLAFSEVSGELRLCSKCKWAVRGELERLQRKVEKGQGQSA
jgi:5-methylcytosine-specific restriction endonuclease McrA